MRFHVRFGRMKTKHKVQSPLPNAGLLPNSRLTSSPLKVTGGLPGTKALERCHNRVAQGDEKESAE